MRSKGGVLGCAAVAFGAGLVLAGICPSELLITILAVALIVTGFSYLKR
ncbi:MAG: hypothetical protein IJY56_03750 [Clostridia bacterium]|nr:hypothetical protein [Clostridia bacterium]